MSTELENAKTVVQVMKGYAQAVCTMYPGLIEGLTITFGWSNPEPRDERQGAIVIFTQQLPPLAVIDNLHWQTSQLTARLSTLNLKERTKTISDLEQQLAEAKEDNLRLRTELQWKQQNG